MMSLNEAILAKYARASRFSVAVAFWRWTNRFSSLVLNITFVKDCKCRLGMDGDKLQNGNLRQ